MSASPWVSGKHASKELGVSEKTLQRWREVGYLKSGTHWRIAYKLKTLSTKSHEIYHMQWCKEEINYWLAQDAPVNDIAA